MNDNNNGTMIRSCDNPNALERFVISSESGPLIEIIIDPSVNFDCKSFFDNYTAYDFGDEKSDKTEKLEKNENAQK